MSKLVSLPLRAGNINLVMLVGARIIFLLHFHAFKESTHDLATKSQAHLQMFFCFTHVSLNFSKVLVLVSHWRQCQFLSAISVL